MMRHSSQKRFTEREARLCFVNPEQRVQPESENTPRGGDNNRNAFRYRRPGERSEKERTDNSDLEARSREIKSRREKQINMKKISPEAQASALRIERAGALASRFVKVREEYKQVYDRLKVIQTHLQAKMKQFPQDQGWKNLADNFEKRGSAIMAKHRSAKEQIEKMDKFSYVAIEARTQRIESIVAELTNLERSTVGEGTRIAKKATVRTPENAVAAAPSKKTPPEQKPEIVRTLSEEVLADNAKVPPAPEIPLEPSLLARTAPPANPDRLEMLPEPSLAIPEQKPEIVRTLSEEVLADNAKVPPAPEIPLEPSLLARTAPPANPEIGGTVSGVLTGVARDAVSNVDQTRPSLEPLPALWDEPTVDTPLVSNAKPNVQEPTVIPEVDPNSFNKLKEIPAAIQKFIGDLGREIDRRTGGVDVNYKALIQAALADANVQQAIEALKPENAVKILETTFQQGIDAAQAELQKLNPTDQIDKAMKSLMDAVDTLRTLVPSGAPQADNGGGFFSVNSTRVQKLGGGSNAYDAAGLRPILDMNKGKAGQKDMPPAWDLSKLGDVARDAASALGKFIEPLTTGPSSKPPESNKPPETPKPAAPAKPAPAPAPAPAAAPASGPTPEGHLSEAEVKNLQTSLQAKVNAFDYNNAKPLDRQFKMAELQALGIDINPENYKTDKPDKQGRSIEEIILRDKQVKVLNGDIMERIMNRVGGVMGFLKAFMGKIKDMLPNLGDMLGLGKKKKVDVPASVTDPVERVKQMAGQNASIDSFVGDSVIREKFFNGNDADRDEMMGEMLKSTSVNKVRLNIGANMWSSGKTDQRDTVKKEMGAIPPSDEQITKFFESFKRVNEGNPAKRTASPTAGPIASPATAPTGEPEPEQKPGEQPKPGAAPQDDVPEMPDTPLERLQTMLTEKLSSGKTDELLANENFKTGLLNLPPDQQKDLLDRIMAASPDFEKSFKDACDKYDLQKKEWKVPAGDVSSLIPKGLDLSQLEKLVRVYKATQSEVPAASPAVVPVEQVPAPVSNPVVNPAPQEQITLEQTQAIAELEKMLADNTLTKDETDSILKKDSQIKSALLSMKDETAQKSFLDRILAAASELKKTVEGASAFYKGGQKWEGKTVAFGTEWDVTRDRVGAQLPDGLTIDEFEKVMTIYQRREATPKQT